jgi:type I restriction enzyme S subunit
MTRRAGVDLPAEHRHIVLGILKAHLPRTVLAWVFGSRAIGRGRPYSDLDLAIDAGRPLTLDQLARLTEAFSESELPYRVDVTDWRSLDDRFRRIIAAERVALNDSAS